MIRQLVAAEVVVAGLAIFAAACVAPAPRDEEASVVSAPTGTPLPAELNEIESLAEDLFEQTFEGNWSRAANLILSLKEAVARAESAQSTEYKRIEELVHRLESAVNDSDPHASALANELTREVIVVSSIFASPVPTEVALLDYHGRALLLASSDKPARALVEARLRATWNRVKPRAQRAGGSAEAKELDSLLSQIQTATTPSAAAGLSQAILEQVDTLENLFMSKGSSR